VTYDLTRIDPREITVRPLRVVPAIVDHDPEAERAVLGAVMLDGDLWDVVSTIVDADDFALPSHAATWRALAALVARGVPLDVVTVAAELTAANRLNSVGGAQYLGELTDGIVTTAYVETHARMVREHSARRQVVAIARSLAARVLSGAPLGPLLAGAMGALESVPLPAIEAPTMARDVDAYFDALEGRAAPASKPVGLGLSDLDAALHGGLRMGSYLLLGLPGTGKTTLAMQWAAHIAATAGWVLFVSKEENRDRLRDALLAHLAHLPMAVVVHARENPSAPMLSADAFASLTVAASTLYGLRLRVADPSTAGCPSTVGDVVAMARGMTPRPVAIVIDNLGELVARGTYGARTDLATEEKMKDLRRAKNLLRIPIITLAHPTSAARSGARPRRLAEGDIAGGQASTRVCDGVLLMHREDLHPTRDHAKDPPTPGCVEIYSSKLRGLSSPLYVEALARTHEHRFISRLRPDADVWQAVEMTDPRPSGVRSTGGASVYDTAGDLPLDPAPYLGETRALDLGPQWGDE